MKTQLITSLLHKHSESKSQTLKELKKVCDDFESEILNFFLKEAMDSTNALFPESPGEKIYKSMYQEQLSKELSGNFGYSKLLFDYLKEKV
ncbi:rod-binding protein [Caminibacter pacificus]